MKKISFPGPVAAIALTFAAALAFTACAGAGAQSSTPTASSTKEAGIWTKDINVCFENKSPSPVAVEWESGLSTHAATSALAAGKTACGEGQVPAVLLTFIDTFTTRVLVSNDVLMYPKVSFRGFSQHDYSACIDGVCIQQKGGLPEWKEYAGAFYSEGETVNSDVEGHQFAVTRNANDDWIQFTVVILG